jgi:hypothetical protein
MKIAVSREANGNTLGSEYSAKFRVRSNIPERPTSARLFVTPCSQRLGVVIIPFKLSEASEELNRGYLLSIL